MNTFPDTSESKIFELWNEHLSKEISDELYNSIPG